MAGIATNASVHTSDLRSPESQGGTLHSFVSAEQRAAQQDTDASLSAEILDDIQRIGALASRLSELQDELAELPTGLVAEVYHGAVQEAKAAPSPDNIRRRDILAAFLPQDLAHDVVVNAYQTSAAS